LPPDTLLRINRCLAGGMTAALKLGDLNLLNADMTWVKGLLKYNQIPPEALGLYLAAYHQAAKTHLGESGQLIVDWLASRLICNP